MEKERSQAWWIAAPFIALFVLHLPALVIFLEVRLFGTVYVNTWFLVSGLWDALDPIYQVTLGWLYG